MTHFAEFRNISERVDALIGDNLHKAMHIPVSKKHSVFMSIIRIGLFRTGGIDVELVSISKVGALFRTTHHALLKSEGKNMTIGLSLNGKCFAYDAHIIQQDTINNFYGIKFEQFIDAIDDYLIEHRIYPYYGESDFKVSSVWLHLATA